MGLFWVFVGEKFFKFIVVVLAFVFGYWLVFVICEQIGGVNGWIVFGVGLAVALICGGLSVWLYKLAVVLFGIFLGVYNMLYMVF